MTAVRQATRASTEDVWALLGDLGNWAGILPTMQRVIRLGGPGPIGAGVRFEVDQPGLPAAVYEITDWQAGRSFRWASSRVGVRTTASHRLDETPDGSELVLGLEWSGPLAWLAWFLAGSKARRMVQQEADLREVG